MESPKLEQVHLSKNPTIAALDKFRAQVCNIGLEHFDTAYDNLSDLRKECDNPTIALAMDEVLHDMGKLKIGGNVKSMKTIHNPKYLN